LLQRDGVCGKPHAVQFPSYQEGDASRPTQMADKIIMHPAEALILPRQTRRERGELRADGMQVA